MGSGSANPERARERQDDDIATHTQVPCPTINHRFRERPGPHSIFGTRTGQGKGLIGSLLAHAALLVPALLLFLPAFGTDRVLAIRDGQHYHYPLWNWVHRQWDQGNLPLWNPHENLGTSLVADPTVAIWYPGQLLLRLPGPFPARYHLLLAIHVVLASWGAYRAARAMGAGRIASVLAGLSYAYGGAVLFLYGNPIYLFGAAWLPWGIAALSTILRRIARQGTWHFSRSLAVVLTLLVLGGDPQMAVHLVMIGLVGLFCWPRMGERHESSGQIPRPIERIAWCKAGLLSLLAPSLLAMGLAAIQIVPTMASLGSTGRASEGRFGDARWTRLEADSFAATRYDFSVGPWRVIETVWPNAGGKMFPLHRRWMSALPAEGRVWSPSLYGGTLLVLLAAASIPLARFVPAVRWWWIATVLAMLAASGHYGLGWCLAELQTWWRGVPTRSLLPHQVGGVYWMLSEWLPGYGWFRYPAKWWTIAALGVALLGALGWDAIFRSACRSSQAAEPHEPGPSLVLARHRSTRWCHRLSLLLMIVNLILAMALALVGYSRPASTWHTWLPSSDWFGPFDGVGAIADLRWSLAASSLSAAILLLVTARQWRGGKRDTCNTGGRLRGLLAGGVLAWCAVDLVTANGWMLSWLPEDCFAPSVAARVTDVDRRVTGGDADANPNHESVMLDDLNARHEGRWYRASSREWWPGEWREHGSRNRLVETARWERRTQFPKWNLLDDRSVVSREDGWAVSEFRDRRTSPETRLLPCTEHPDSLPTESIPANYPASSWFQVLDVRHRIVPPDPNALAKPNRASLSSHPGPSDQKEAWLIPRIEEGRAEQSPDDLLVAEVGRIAGIERIGNVRVSVTVEVARPVWLVLSEQFDDDWKATVVPLSASSRPAARQDTRTSRAYGLLRAVPLAPGVQRVEWTYRPQAWYVGTAISVCCAMALGLQTILARRARRRPDKQEGLAR